MPTNLGDRERLHISAEDSAHCSECTPQESGAINNCAPIQKILDNSVFGAGSTTILQNTRHASTNLWQVSLLVRRRKLLAERQTFYNNT